MAKLIEKWDGARELDLASLSSQGVRRQLRKLEFRLNKGKTLNEPDEPIEAIQLNSSVGEELVCNEVRKFLKELLRLKQFNMSHIRRLQNKIYINEHVKKGEYVKKPYGLEIKEMFNEEFLQHGKEVLASGTHGLIIEGIRSNHVMSCKFCQQYNVNKSSSRSIKRIHPKCYGMRMEKLVTHGWKPVIDEEAVVERYDCICWILPRPTIILGVGMENIPRDNIILDLSILYGVPI